VTIELEVAATPADAARRVADVVAERTRRAVESRGRFTLALSRASSELLRALVAVDLPWPETAIYQVDERVAPEGDPARNLTALLAELPGVAHGSLRPMPVGEADLESGARRYAAELPSALDLVHLGLGPDGHTASLVPGDTVLDVRDRPVAVTGEYRGRRRMTLTYPALDTAREVVWLVTGEEKRDALARLLAGDATIPAARVAAPRQLVVADTASAPAR
jgi:6-phosphogluconolactonase